MNMWRISFAVFFLFDFTFLTVPTQNKMSPLNTHKNFHKLYISPFSIHSYWLYCVLTFQLFCVENEDVEVLGKNRKRSHSASNLNRLALIRKDNHLNLGRMVPVKPKVNGRRYEDLFPLFYFSCVFMISKHFRI